MMHRLVLTIATIAGTASAQGGRLEDGRDLFLYFCAECHGRDAASVGPMAEMLALEPPDLTGLSLRNAGNFPAESVARQIDGRNPIAAHGDMPVFGPTLNSDLHVAIILPDGQRLLASSQLANLLTYLSSVQIKK